MIGGDVARRRSKLNRAAMRDFFISYCRVDLQIVEQLSQWLREQGWSLLLEEELPPSQSLMERMEYALENVRSIIVLWSEDSVRDALISYTADLALAEKKLIQIKLPIVPISDIPEKFRGHAIVTLDQLSIFAKRLPAEAEAELTLSELQSKRKQCRQSSPDEALNATTGLAHSRATASLRTRASFPTQAAPRDAEWAPAAPAGQSAPPETGPRSQSVRSAAVRPESASQVPSTQRAARKRVALVGVTAAAIAALAAVATVVFRDGFSEALSAIGSGMSKLLAVLNLNASPPPITALPGRDRQADVVDCTAFAPPTAQPGKPVFVQIFLHAPDQLERAESIAQKIDPGSTLRGIATLQAEVERGQKIGVTLDCPEIVSGEATREIVWMGHPQAISFRVTIPLGTRNGRPFIPVVRLSLDGVPVGFVEFCLTALDAETDAARPTGEDARRYRYAFLSYASQDRSEVIRFARALKAARIDFFQDILSLEPGEEWETRLYEEIDKCDVLYLFWSRHAAASQMVRKEAEYAYGRAMRAGRKVPDITPIRLDGSPLPTNPPHPAWMTKIHFDDYFRKLIES